jgi:hypothetical protein
MRLCQVAAGPAGEAAPAPSDFPRPGAGEVRFYLLTTAGVRTAAADEATLRAGKHALSALYAAGQDVISALRSATGAPARR